MNKYLEMDFHPLYVDASFVFAKRETVSSMFPIDAVRVPVPYLKGEEVVRLRERIKVLDEKYKEELMRKL